MARNNNYYKNILFTSSNFPSGGPGAVFLNLFCKGLKLNNRSVRVYMTRGYAFGDNSKTIYRKNSTDEGVLYSSLGLTKRPQNSLLKIIDDLLSFCHLLLIIPCIAFKRRQRCIFVYHTDLLHSLVIYLASSLFRIRVVTFVPEYFYKEQLKGLLGKLKWFNFILNFDYLIPLSGDLIVFSHFLKDIYSKKGFKKKNIFVLPNLTDFEFWKTPATEEKFTVGYSGTPGRKDGLLDLFAAIKLLRDTYPVNLCVVGDSTFGNSLIPYLENECRNLGIIDQVHFTGLVEHEKVKNWLSQCRILAITRPRTIQTQAGFPTKLGEYMALKKPVLATDFGEVERYFKDGEEIVLAKSDDPVSIAEKLKWMIKNNDITEKIALNGYSKAYEQLSYERVILKVIEFLDRI